MEKLNRSTAKNLEPFSKPDHVSHPVQKGAGVTDLSFDVDGLVSVHGIHDHWAIELGRVGTRETGITIGTPLHRSSNTVAVAEINVVAHSNFVAVIDDRRARK